MPVGCGLVLVPVLRCTSTANLPDGPRKIRSFWFDSTYYSSLEAFATVVSNRQGHGCHGYWIVSDVFGKLWFL